MKLSILPNYRVSIVTMHNNVVCILGSSKETIRPTCDTRFYHTHNAYNVS